MLLNKTEIQKLLSLLAEKTIVKPSSEFPFRISQKGMGYSDDLEVSKLQAKLSIMLQVAGD